MKSKIPGEASGQLKGLGEFARQQMKQWGAVGCAIGVVRDDRVIYAKGFGVADARLGNRVNTNTRFHINSMTKPFTATATAILVDDGIIEWDKPIKYYIPDFRMHDPVATEHATMRDLLTHRTGLPPHYCSLFSSQSTEAPILERMAYLEPFTEFRSKFRYTNITYAAVGEIIERLTGKSWEDFVESRIFRPLGMNDSTFATRLAKDAENVAVGHVKEKEAFLPWTRGKGVDLASCYASKRGAAAIVSTVHDMCHWLRYQMRPESFGDTGILRPATLRELHSAQVVAVSIDNNRDLGDASYSVGWMLQPYRGRRRVYHGGGGRGFTSDAAFLPYESIGVVMLCNSSAPHVGKILEFNIYDRLLGLEPIPWNERFARMVFFAAEKAKASGKPSQLPRSNAAPPPRPIEDYAGEYFHAGYGWLSVAANKGRLKILYNGMAFRARHLRDDVFEIRGCHEEEVVREAVFGVNKSGAASTVSIQFERLAPEIVFEREW